MFGVLGGTPAEIEYGVFLDLNFDTAGGNNFDNFQRNAGHILQSQKYLGRQCLPLPLIKSAYVRAKNVGAVLRSEVKWGQFLPVLFPLLLHHPSSPFPVLCRPSFSALPSPGALPLNQLV